MTFQEKLVVLRKIKGLTQDDFASVVGVSRQAVYKWESGQSDPELKKLVRIKELFNISIDDLLDENYIISLPEKKRKKRMNKDLQRQIEAIIEAEEAGRETDNSLDELLAQLKSGEIKKEVAPAPKAEPEAVATPAPKAEPKKVAAPAPKAEPVAVAAPAPKAEPEVVEAVTETKETAEPVITIVEEAAPVATAAPVKEADEPAKKKKGLFGLFRK